FRLLPLASLPQELREQVLRICTSTAEDAVAYRRRIARHAEWIWFARLSQAIRQVSWSGIRANPGVAIAATAIAVWVVAAVSVTMLTFAGSGAANAQAAQTSAETYSKNPAAAPTASKSVAARPSPTVTRPSVYMPTPVQSA